MTPEGMTPEAFIEKWRAVTLTERAAAQSHFNDLCALLAVEPPAVADPLGRDYAFEKTVTKPDGRTGYADVWKRGHFAWEYKGSRSNLVRAYSQLKDYADALENPPLLIVSDMKEIRVHTNFTNTVAETRVIALADLLSPETRQYLRWAFTDPERLRPTTTREKVTAEAASAFGALAEKLNRQFEPQRVAHFLNKLVFSLFAEDIDLLPSRVFADVIEEAAKHWESFVPVLGSLFRAMRQEHSYFGATAIPWFDGGLFDDDDVLPLGYLEIKDLADATRLDWSAIEPSIFGTLFEQGLNPERRKQMAGLFDAPVTADPQPGLFDRHLHQGGQPDKAVGVHYTDPDKIMKIIAPVVLRPLRAEWDEVKREIAAEREKKAKARTGASATAAENRARDRYFAFRDRLGRFRVLDPACGSGNFLYLALFHLKDLDLQIIKEAETLGLPADGQRVGPDAVMGIEINPYAAELARVTIWIGEIQWQMRNGYGIRRRPILGPLRQIVCRDALLNPNGTEARWPDADAVVGNPPFLGDKAMIRTLGQDYVGRLRRCFAGRVPGGADLVCYWFEKARAMIEEGQLRRAGLVATNSIRGGANRRVLDRIRATGAIFDAWADEPWIIEGAAVRVSMVCLGKKEDLAAEGVLLNGQATQEIFADLTGDYPDLTQAKMLIENRGIARQGATKGGAFDIEDSLARYWLSMPLNPNGRPNSDVVRPWINGLAITDRGFRKWIIDFGEMTEADASLYEEPFSYIEEHVKPVRTNVSRLRRKRLWWQFNEPAPGLRRSIASLKRVIVTPELAKHRIFIWVSTSICADKNVVVIIRDDDTSFGCVHSKIHQVWSSRLGTSLEDRPRYTSSSTFRTFPFPEGLTPNIPVAEYADDPRAQRIAAAARRLNELREAWLNPPDLVRREPEVVPGYPDRVLPVDARAAAILKKRTLTNLYNDRPAWLAAAHRDLDDAVAAAYGWPPDLSDDEILARLFALNQARGALTSSEAPE